MSRLVECVPNFSEGRRPEVIDLLQREIVSVPGVALLDREMDKDHNRAVLTFIGEPEAVKKAAFRAIAKAAELIDMEKHEGEHPRLGATDVVPFVPVSEVTMEECVQLARELGQEVGEKLGIPVYLYEAAATRPDRVNLADIRKGEYEGLKEKIGKNPDRKPDFGPDRLHPTAGATVIGARMPLIAYNVYLGTADVSIAKSIAKRVRESSGGLPSVKALGFEIKERNLVQVSMNLTNYLKTPIHQAVEAVKTEAKNLGVPVVSTELVGLAPLDSFLATAEYYLKLENFKRDQILETKLLSLFAERRESLADFVDRVASADPTPGGGSVAALSAALASALTAMVCRLTVGKKKFAAVESELQEVLRQAERLRQETYQLIQHDADAFQKVLEAYKLPKETEKEREVKDQVIEKATRRAAEIPLEVMRQGVEVLRLSDVVAEKGNPNSKSDAGVAALLARAAIEGAWLNVEINLRSIRDAQFVKRVKDEGHKVLAAARAPRPREGNSIPRGATAPVAQ